MPLLPDDLADELEYLFANAPPSFAECAQEWGAAMDAYAAGIVPPSTTVSAAAATLAGALTGAFATPLAIPGMIAAFAAFAAAAGAGMAPLFVPVPPPAPLGLAAHFANTYDSHAEAAGALADLIHAWMGTGTATPAAGGPPVNWT